ncbi:MAG TPA: D-alanyl-D-alanine carboxypeptidase family protein [Stellaceae bacterium]|nr:D-alanyl-D-alanine carboxypeptidase family protein [Stellaceae bacterium]
MSVSWSQIAAASAALVAISLLAPGSPAARPRVAHVAAPRPTTAPAPIQPTIGPVDTEATHAYIVEADTGRVLLDKNGDQRIPTASLSKMMTAYTVFDLLRQGKAKLTDQLPVSEAAWRTAGSKMFVPLGGRVSIDDLLQGMIVQSGNDACVVLAEGLAGSQQAFVDLMNDEAKKIGLINSHFADVDGLPTPDHYMTPHDMATLALHLIRDFPQYYHYFAEKEFTFNNIRQGNRNPLLYKDIGADGLKTGHTEESGYSLVASVHRGGRRVILVLNGMPTMQARAEEGERLADWAFREYNDYKLFAAGQTVAEAPVWLGVEDEVPLAVEKDLVVTLSRPERQDMKVTVDYTAPVSAPIRVGEMLGKVIVTAPDEVAVEAPLYAAAAVPRMGPMGRAAMVAAHLIWGSRN